MRLGVFKGYSTDKRVNATVDAFAQGLEHLGENFFVGTEYEPCDVAVIWGITSKRALQNTAYRDAVRQQQNNTICIERGFVNRENYYSVGWYNTGGLGDYFNSDIYSDDRWSKLKVELREWKTTGEVILLCGQVPHDTSVQHIDYRKWLTAAARELLKRSGRKIVFRPHPLFQDIEIEGVERSNRTLIEDFERAFAVVTFNSTTAVDSVIAGIPTYSFDKRSMAYEVTSHSFKTLDNPPTFEREAWANRLAYTQWHIDEIRQGKPWLHLKNRLQPGETLSR